MEFRKVLRIIAFLFVAMAASSAYAKGFDGTYEARVGDLNGDSLTDIYLKPKPQITTILLDDLTVPVPLPTDVSPFVLRRLPDQTFEIVSTLTSAQRATIGQWPASSIVVELIDANMDSATDAVVREIPGANDHVVLAAPGNRLPPIAVKAMDAIRTTFLEDLAYWMKDPAYETQYTEVNWFMLWDLMVNNVVVNGFPVSGNPYDPENAPDVCWYTNCDYDPFYGWLVLLEITYPVLVYQHPIHTAEAFYLTQAIGPTLQNPVILAQSAEAIFIADVIEALLGTTEVMNGALTQGGTRDPEAGIPPSEVPRSRAWEVLVMLAELFVPPLNFSGWRYLTPGEKSILALGNGLKIRNVDRVRVHNYGFLGLQNYIISPNGHIYVGSSSGMLWSNDYSPSSTDLLYRGVFVHELMHVFQNRTWHCRISNGCMIVQKLLALNDYCYVPLVTGKQFRSYNLEEEAEMVSDRYRMRQGSGAALTCNQTTPTLEPQLQALIPF